MFNSDLQNTNIKDTEADEQNVHELNNKLRQMNEQLILKNSSLQKQFDDLLQIQDQIECIHKQNSKLTEDLRKATEEKDELSKRLEINVKIIDEVKQNAEAEKKELQQKLQKANDEMCAKVDMEKNQTEKEFKQKIDEMSALIENQEKELNQMKKTNMELLESAKIYFNQSFNDSETLNYYFRNNKKDTSAKNDSLDKNLTDAMESIKKLKLKQKKLKQKCQNDKIKLNESANEIDLLKKQNKELKNDNTIIITNMKKKIDDLKKQNSEKQKQNENNFNKQISTLNEMLENEKKLSKELEEKLEKAQGQKDSKDEIKELCDKQIESLNNQIREIKTSLISSQNQNSCLTKQIQTLSEKKRNETKELINENKELKKNNSELQNENEKIKLELSKLKDENLNCTSKINDLNLTNDHYNSIFNDEKNKNKKINESLDILKITFNKQKEEIEKLNKQKNNFIGIIQKQEKALNEFEHICNELNQKLKSQKTQIKMQQKTINQNNNKFKSIEIPITSFICSSFPRELCSIIYKIVNNDDETLIKLKNVLEKIGDYYNNEISLLTKKEEVSKRINQKIENILTSLSELLKDSSINFNEFIENTKFDQYLISKISQLINSNIELNSINNKLEEGLNSIHQELNTASIPEILAQIDNLKVDITKLISRNNKLQKNQKKVKKSTKELKEQTNKEFKHAQDEIMLKNERIQELEEENELLNKKYQDLIKKSSQIKMNFINQLSDSQKEKTEGITRLHKHIEENNNMHDEKIQQKDNQIKEMKDKINQLELESAQWKQTAIYLSNIKVDNEQQIHKLEEKLEKKKSNQNQEPQKLAQYIQTIEQFKLQNNELRNMLDKITKSASDYEVKNNEIKERINELSLENQRLKSRIDLQTDEIEREKQILNSKMKATEISITTKAQIDTEIIKTSFSNEKRKLYAFFANNFNYLFDPTQKLTDDNFKKFVIKCSDEMQLLMKQEQSIRRLLGINQGENIEKAISSILVLNH